jgi:phosphoserine phosphatase
MSINFNQKNQWLDSHFDIKPEMDAKNAPYSNNYFLFAVSPASALNEIIAQTKGLYYQLLSSKCIWISLPESFTGKQRHDLEKRWELCKGTSFRPIKPQLISFDMDSTLIAEEVIDEIARDAGCYQQVAAVTEEAMQGRLDFNQSLIKRVSLIKGFPEERLAAIAARLNFSEGAEILLSCLHHQNIKTAILSGGFNFFAMKISAKLGIKIVHANQLQIVSHQLSGKVIPPIMNAALKAQYLEIIARKYAIEISSTMAVGDGANDLEVLKLSGLGIAWHAKPAVAKQADVAINYLGLDVISWLWD